MDLWWIPIVISGSVLLTLTHPKVITVYHRGSYKKYPSSILISTTFVTRTMQRSSTTNHTYSTTIIVLKWIIVKNKMQTMNITNKIVEIPILLILPRLWYWARVSTAGSKTYDKSISQTLRSKIKTEDIQTRQIVINKLHEEIWKKKIQTFWKNTNHEIMSTSYEVYADW
jgi:hypothetical protein